MALTRYLHHHGTLIGQYLHERYPNTAGVVRAANRTLADAATIRPDDGAHYPWAIAARAIGLRLRAEFTPLPVANLVAARGAQMLTQLPDAPYPLPVAAALLDELGAITARHHARPDRAAPDEELDRACAVLALLEDLARTLRIAESALTSPTLPRTVAGWLALPTPALVADISQMAGGMIARHPDLFAASGMLFPRFAIMRGAGGALDPLLVGETLYLSKATAQPAITGAWLRELVGYSLLDLDNSYGITRVGLLLPRQGETRTWPLASLAAILAADSAATLPALRHEFAQMRLLAGDPLTDARAA